MIIAAIGRPHFVRTEFVREGATVIDVGINRVEDAGSERGYKLVGDVDFEGCFEISRCHYSRSRRCRPDDDRDVDVEHQSKPAGKLSSPERSEVKSPAAPQPARRLRGIPKQYLYRNVNGILRLRSG